jgi:hypothetical protein
MCMRTPILCRCRASARSSAIVRLTNSYILLAVCLLTPIVSACGRNPKPHAAPASLGLDGPGTYAAYLASTPQHFKMRHTVESTFGTHREVIEGFLVAERPDRLYVVARSPMGMALFDVKSVPPAPPEVTAHIAALSDPRMARFLARDIGRIYLRECPSDAAVEPVSDGYVVRCMLASSDDGIVDDEPDDAVEVYLGPGAELKKKVFAHAGQVTATITYDDQRQVEGVWLPHFIELTHASQAYRLRIVLLATDFGFDTSRIFGSRAE